MTKIDVTVTSEPQMKHNKNNEPYVTFYAIDNSTKNSSKAYFVVVYNKYSMNQAYLYLNKGDKVTLEGKLKPSDKTEQRFIMRSIGTDFIEKIYS